MGVGIIGQDGTPLKVDSVSGAARVTQYDDAGNPSTQTDGDQPTWNVAGSTMLGLNDRMVLPIRLDRLGSQSIAAHEPLFTDSFDGTSQNAIRWTQLNTSQAVTQAPATGMVLNSGNVTTINTGCLNRTSRAFLKSQRQPLHTKIRARLDKQANSVMELGFGDATTLNGANTAGAFWQVTASGIVQPVVTFNAVDQSGTDISPLINANNFYTFDVFLDDDEAIFICQDTSTGLVLSKQSIKLPATGPRLWSSVALPVLLRLYNTGVAPVVAPHLIVTDVYVAGLDAFTNKPFAELMAAQDRGTIHHPVTGAQLAQWSNSADPASAALSNTAAGYTTLGGRFQFAMTAGAVTDFALFGFQVPANTNLHITGIDIELWNTGAANAATPSRFEFAVAVGSTAVSLATATVGRRGLGAIGLPASAAIGVRGDRVIEKQFSTPLFCAANRFTHIILRNPVPNAATASQIIQGMCNIEGYFS